LKRLLWYLNQITDTDTTTFRYTVMVDRNPVQKEIYDGECIVTYRKPGGEAASERTGIRREPTYWRDGISYTFDRTNRMALDRPTITIAIPVDRLNIMDYTVAAADFCLRKIATYFELVNKEYENKARPDSDNGNFYVYAPGGEVLVRNAAYFAMCPAKDYENGHGAGIYVTKFIDPPPDIMCLCIRIQAQLPHGNLKRMRKMLVGNLPDETERFVREFDREGLKYALVLVLEKKQNAIRKFLREENYCAFIANGSILAREKGTEFPMKDALPFQSTTEDEITVAGVRGMGIRRGVTVITGGGYSGKSTILNAVSAGIYNHVAGDGRELCITDHSAVTITAEDGRAISCLNISPFIKWIPDGDTCTFSTTHASGSTSQAANIIEAIECGSTLLLIDEDRSATNFMIRDVLMKELIKKEPITPFTDRVRELSANGVSTILVIGGSSEYLGVADKIYMMDDFVIHDVTLHAKSISCVSSEPPSITDWTTRRVLLNSGFTPYPQGSGTEKLEVSDTGFIVIGDERIDVRNLHDIATAAQVDALAFMLRFLERRSDDGNELERLALAMRGLDRKTVERKIDVAMCVSKLYEQIELEGINIVDTGFFTTMNHFLDLPREYDLRAAINRMRRVSWATLRN
jgi:hypothetical protein